MFLSSLDCSPLKNFRSERRKTYGKRKIYEASRSIDNSIAVALDMTALNTSGEGSSSQESCVNCSSLMENLKEKISSLSDKSQKPQYLTLIPETWSREYAGKYFDVFVISIRQAREMKKKCGILSQPTKETRIGLSEALCEKVVSFYYNDDVSGLCPGKKDSVRVKNTNGEKVKKQKRFPLGNLKEIFLRFKKENSEKIGFSSFFALRPKECVTVGSSGAHSVCVCIIHQNVELMVAAINHNIYWELYVTWL